MTAPSSDHHHPHVHDPDVRFSLANERTFLAWGRTGLSIVALGVAVVKLLAGSHPGALDIAAGLGLILLGTALGVGAFIQYRRTDDAIRRDQPVPRSFLPVALLLTLVAAGIFAAAISTVRF